MNCFILLPWGGDGGLAGNAELMEYYLEKQGNYDEVGLIAPGHLEHVGAGDILLIYGHTGAGLNEIQSNPVDESNHPSVNGTRKSMSAEALAALMALNKLTKNIQTIILYTCFSASSTNKSISFAERLQRALKGKSYNKVTVYGYTKVTKDPFSKNETLKGWTITNMETMEMADQGPLYNFMVGFGPGSGNKIQLITGKPVKTNEKS